MADALTRTIAGIENRTAQEVFDIMCDRINRTETLAIDMLKAIIRHGELDCVSAERGYLAPSGGKKPATKDVWQIPRHMLADIEAVIAAASTSTKTE